MNDVILGFINVQFFAAGLFGGLVHSFRLEKATPWRVIGHIVAGGFAGNFLAPLALAGASNFIPPYLLKIVPPGFVAAGFGLTGRHSCYLLEMAFKSWNPLGKTKNE